MWATHWKHCGTWWMKVAHWSGRNWLCVLEASLSPLLPAPCRCPVATVAGVQRRTPGIHIECTETMGVGMDREEGSGHTAVGYPSIFMGQACWVYWSHWMH